MPLMWHAGEPRDGVLWVEINWKDRPVNALSRDTLAELSELIGRIRSDSAITGVVFKSGKSGNFIAGADVTDALATVLTDRRIRRLTAPARPAPQPRRTPTSRTRVVAKSKTRVTRTA